jgi:hypothetical protein
MDANNGAEFKGGIRANYCYLYGSANLFSAKSMKKHHRHNELGENQPDHYKWGIFYYNPDDARVIVPKR